MQISNPGKRQLSQIPDVQKLSEDLKRTAANGQSRSFNAATKLPGHQLSAKSRSLYVLFLCNGHLMQEAARL
jgi:hypothetical protein